MSPLDLRTLRFDPESGLGLHEDEGGQGKESSRLLTFSAIDALNEYILHQIGDSGTMSTFRYRAQSECE